MSNDALTEPLDRVWCIPDALRALAPEAVALLDETNASAWRAFPPVLLEQLRLRIAALIGNEAARQRRSSRAQEDGLSEAKLTDLDRYYACDSYSALERDCLEFAEQFVMDVSGPMQNYLPQLQTHFPGEQLRGFVTALYVTEFTQRLELIATALLEAAAPVESVAPTGVTTSRDDARHELAQRLRDYQNAVVRRRAVDPVLTELVRLRCARTHNCRICQTLRLADARVAGADDDMTDKVDFYEQSDLDERSKTALRITDAMITAPTMLTDAVVAQTRRLFSPEEVAELCLDITKWSVQKIHVALGTDGADALPKNAHGVSFLTFDEDGRVGGFSATLG